MGLNSLPREAIRLDRAVDEDRPLVGWSRQGLCLFKGAGLNARPKIRAAFLAIDDVEILTEVELELAALKVPYPTERYVFGLGRHGRKDTPFLADEMYPAVHKN
jgi:hypothetical protein